LITIHDFESAGAGVTHLQIGSDFAGLLLTSRFHVQNIISHILIVPKVYRLYISCLKKKKYTNKLGKKKKKSLALHNQLFYTFSFLRFHYLIKSFKTRLIYIFQTKVLSDLISIHIFSCSRNSFCISFKLFLFHLVMEKSI
jgi:hypothetical protein